MPSVRLILLLLAAGLWAVLPAAAQDETPEATAEATVAVRTPDAETTPLTQIVGVTPRGEPVNIRSGPGIAFPRIGLPPTGRTVVATGYNDFDLERVCSPEFRADLDMWLRVEFRGVEGWVARCAVEVNGDLANLSSIDTSLMTPMPEATLIPFPLITAEPTAEFTAEAAAEATAPISLTLAP